MAVASKNVWISADIRLRGSAVCVVWFIAGFFVVGLFILDLVCNKMLGMSNFLKLNGKLRSQRVRSCRMEERLDHSNQERQEGGATEKRFWVALDASSSSSRFYNS